MSWYFVDCVGCCNFMFYGFFVLMIIFILMGGFVVMDILGFIKGIVVMILFYCWWYNVMIGVMVYMVLCEVLIFCL